MGFYIRKSISVGPIRFNLSKSGIGVSAGVRGLRVGTGPRGNYVHVGTNGIYYRATLPSGVPQTQPPLPLPPPEVDQLHPIESGSPTEMRDSSSEELLSEIQEKRQKWRLAPVVLVLGSAATTMLAMSPEVTRIFPSWALVVPATLTLVLATFAHRRDELAKTVVLFYDLEDANEHQYQALHDAFGEILSCNSVWHVAASGAGDWKRSGGATTQVRRSIARPRKAAPSGIRTNIEVPSIPCGRTSLYFFPDRMLVYSGGSVGAVAYSALRIEVSSTRFVEDGYVPRDAQVVGQTWLYVNRNGGPDRRFKNNRQLPIALYAELHFTSNSGLNELLQLSKLGVGQVFEQATRSLAAAL